MHAFVKLTSLKLLLSNSEWQLEVEDGVEEMERENCVITLRPTRKNEVSCIVKDMTAGSNSFSAKAKRWCGLPIFSVVCF